ncbi:DUF177 domain-containing protein [Pseudodesulfovibrio sp. F-1]|uniref:DUF177 domain-containing protein n=1 Tax=Pseudodesulfovibrio alkaliphilus TaxID=2661613 RepID=A0A7K1KKD3_9BACT|nr:DUF177 domain-containing protein [Pseudodesulfovibrio alkaliphilus]MUM76533.1 DUF177 domain-containing protein [Pseudodesulfovibrio alkaliphilus]
MQEHWIAISDIPAQGREIVFDDQTLWRQGCDAYSLKVKPGRDLVAVFTVLPQDNGALVRGTLEGSVFLPCDRCATDFEFAIDTRYDLFEQLPGGEDEADEEPRVREQGGELQLDIGALLWEEFALALPVKPLCAESCKGVCPGCGADRNTEVCQCKADEGDERLAVFRTLKLK